MLDMIADYASCTAAAASKQVTTQTSYVCSVTLAPGAAAATLSVYDSSAAGTTKPIVTVQAVASGQSVNHDFSCPIVASSGIYITVSGTGATGYINYARASG